MYNLNIIKKTTNRLLLCDANAGRMEPSLAAVAAHIELILVVRLSAEAKQLATLNLIHAFGLTQAVTACPTVHRLHLVLLDVHALAVEPAVA